MKISDVGESALIERIRRIAGGADAGVVTGIGDDAAIIHPFTNKVLVSSDMLVEGTHFRLSTISPFQLGLKSIAVNVSDIRAMGGAPRYVLLSLALPRSLDMEDFSRYAEGVSQALKRYGIVLLGGDTCRSDAGLTISVSIIGEAEWPIKRSGAKSGAGVFVTGTLGDSMLRLRVLEITNARFDPDKPDPAGLPAELRSSELLPYAVSVLRRHLMPDAVTSDFSGATSMIDISDGLMIDLGRLCEAGGLGVRIDAASLPLSGACRALAPLMGLDPLDTAMIGGEDYELLFSAPREARFEGATLIGEFVEADKTIIFPDGRVTELRPKGYNHFK